MSSLRSPSTLILGSSLATMLALATFSNASVPTGAPVFTTPLVISNPYFPFVVGAVKVYRGEDDGELEVVVNNFDAVTRTFTWSGGSADARQLREVEFTDGEIAEISYNYFAQSDDGSVYYFGEVVDIYENGVVVGHDGSWLVGGATQPSDPIETANAPIPAVFMIANPEKDDQFKPEDLAPIVDETVTIQALNAKVNTEAGKFKNCLKVKETSSLSPGSESKWYAPGIGLVREKGKDAQLDLIATSILPNP